MESSTAEFLERRLAFELLPMGVWLENLSELARSHRMHLGATAHDCATYFNFFRAALARKSRLTLSNHCECDNDDHTFSAFWL